jgi:hypothetical protein
MSAKKTINGCPDFEGRSVRNVGQSLSPSPYAAELRWRAEYPYRGSREYQRAIDACVTAQKAQRKPNKTGSFRLVYFDWNPRLVAAFIAVLIGLGTVLWVSYELEIGVLGALSHQTTLTNQFEGNQRI